MLRKILLPAFAIAALAGCATGYNYRGGNGSGDYYYGEPSVEYRYHGGYGYYGGYGYGGYGYYGLGYPVYGYPYAYYGGGYPSYPYGYGGGRYPSYPYGHGPRRPHGPDYGHDDDDDGDHAGPRPPQDGHRPGNRPPWRGVGRVRDHDEGEQAWPRRIGQAEAQPEMQSPAPRVRPSAPGERELTSAPMERERSSAPMQRDRTESRPRSGGMRGGGHGERARVRAARSSADD